MLRPAIRCLFLISLLFSSLPAVASNREDELMQLLSEGMPSENAAKKSSPGILKCTIEKQVACQEDKCGKIASTEWVELDINTSSYRRCNKDHGCNSYGMMVNQSGDYTVISLPENGVVFKASMKDKRFTEAASVADVLVNSFGTCEGSFTPAQSVKLPEAPAQPKLKTKSAKVRNKHKEQEKIALPMPQSMSVRQPKSLPQVNHVQPVVHKIVPRLASNNAW